MSVVSDIGVAQTAADYVGVRKRVKIFGIAAMCFGALHLLLGAVPPGDYVLAGFGALLLGAGIYNVATPKPLGLALAGGLLVLVGILNISDTVMGAMAGIPGGSRWAVIGAFQIMWGVSEFMRFNRFRNAFTIPPQEHAIQYATEVIKELKRAKPKDDTDVLEFVVGGNWQPKRVRMRLMPESVACLLGGDDILFLSPDRVEIEDAGKVMIGSKRKANVTLGDEKLKGKISQEALERFRMWKLGSALAQAA